MQDAVLRGICQSHHIIPSIVISISIHIIRRRRHRQDQTKSKN